MAFSFYPYWGLHLCWPGPAGEVATPPHDLALQDPGSGTGHVGRQAWHWGATALLGTALLPPLGSPPTTLQPAPPPHPLNHHCTERAWPLAQVQVHASTHVLSRSLSLTHTHTHMLTHTRVFLNMHRTVSCPSRGTRTTCTHGSCIRLSTYTKRHRPPWVPQPPVRAALGPTSPPRRPPPQGDLEGESRLSWFDNERKKAGVGFETQEKGWAPLAPAAHLPPGQLWADPRFGKPPSPGSAPQATPDPSTCSAVPPAWPPWPHLEAQQGGPGLLWGWGVCWGGSFPRACIRQRGPSLGRGTSPTSPSLPSWSLCGARLPQAREVTNAAGLGGSRAPHECWGAEAPPAPGPPASPALPCALN